MCFLALTTISGRVCNEADLEESVVEPVEDGRDSADDFVGVDIASANMRGPTDVVKCDLTDMASVVSDSFGKAAVAGRSVECHGE